MTTTTTTTTGRSDEGTSAVAARTTIRTPTMPTGFMATSDLASLVGRPFPVVAGARGPRRPAPQPRPTGSVRGELQQLGSFRHLVRYIRQ